MDSTDTKDVEVAWELPAFVTMDTEDEPWMEYDERMFDVSDEPSREFTSYYDVLDEHSNAVKMIHRIGNGQSLISALKKMDPRLVAEASESAVCCGNTVINEGQIGCATKFGKTIFYPPGTYWWLGLGVVFDRVEQIERSGGDGGTTLRYQDVTYLNVPASNCAVLQISKKQIILGSGRYLFRAPVINHGRVNLQNLTIKKYCTSKREVAGKCLPGQNPRDVVDTVEDVKEESGQHESCGAITFVRARPGYCWVVQNSHGHLRTGIGMTVCRGGEKFLDFVNRQNHARTTRTFHMESKDRQEVQIRVQLRWRLENAKVWKLRKGASEDIFDAIEEICESLLRDAIASATYEQCHQAQENGYQMIETSVVETLRKESRYLGGQLIGFEIRSLRFPLLEMRNKQRAQDESLLSEQILQEKRQLDIAVEGWKRDDGTLMYQMREEKKKLQHDMKMQITRDEENLAAMKARAKLELQNQRFEIEKVKISLQAKQTQQILELEQEEADVRSKVKRELSDAKSVADESIRNAQAEADMIRQKCDADAKAKLSMADAEAKAAALIGASYKDNNAYMELQVARLKNDVSESRARNLKKALDANGLVMLPPKLQAELAEFIPVGSMKTQPS